MIMSIKSPEYAQRRTQLMQQMQPNSVAILYAAPVVKRSYCLDYPYRPNSDFYYLSGFNEPEAVLVMIPGRKNGEFVVFCREKNQAQELWHGKRLGLQGVMNELGANEALPIGDIDQILPNLIAGKDALYYAFADGSYINAQINKWLTKVKKNAYAPTKFIDLEDLLHEMRVRKSSTEIALMQKAADISADAHIKAMQNCQVGMYEYQLEAILEHHFKQNGAKFCAYNSIVAAGNNACTLHYTDNNCVIDDNDLILIDAGCELDCYASDVTRTFPANGKFTSEQLALYDVVLQANLAAIDCIKPGISFDLPHQISVEIITEGLLELGILQGDKEQLIQQGAYKDFYMHRVSHWLGLDVHDVGSYREQQNHQNWRNLEVAMVLTIEPGIYIAADNQQVAPKWRGIGIRIEDDIVVTPNGCQVLTNKVPKDPKQIELLMQGK